MYDSPVDTPESGDGLPDYPFITSVSSSPTTLSTLMPGQPESSQISFRSADITASHGARRKEQNRSAYAAIFLAKLQKLLLTTH
jgi:hypothetical protein